MGLKSFTAITSVKWTSIVGGVTHRRTKNDGTIWAWGNNIKANWAQHRQLSTAYPGYYWDQLEQNRLRGGYILDSRAITPSGPGATMPKANGVGSATTTLIPTQVGTGTSWAGIGAVDVTLCRQHHRSALRLGRELRRAVGTGDTIEPPP